MSQDDQTPAWKKLKEKIRELERKVREWEDGPSPETEPPTPNPRPEPKPENDDENPPEDLS